MANDPPVDPVHEPPTTPMLNGPAGWTGDAATSPGVADAPRWTGESVTPPAGVHALPATGESTARTEPASTRRARASDRLRVETAEARRRRVEQLSPEQCAWLGTGRSGPLSGRLLSDFQVGAVLGEGGMGVVYRAVQIGLDRRVALKVLPRTLTQNPVLVDRFAGEARAAGLVVSPHVVQVYFAGSSDNEVFFAMEVVDGGDLGHVLATHRVQNKRLAVPEVLRWMQQAARGLAAAADHHIVHRDIKPQNLLLGDQGMIKIADFGIAKIIGESGLTQSGSTVGTPAYTSPEQGRGDPVDGRSDLYSLGVVFYELLTLQKPFQADKPEAMIYQHNFTEPPLPRELVPDLDPAIEAVCMRLLMKDPAQRYQLASDLASDLERLCAGDATSIPVFAAVYGTGAKDAARRHLGRRRWWPWALVAATLVFITLATLGRWRGIDQEAQEIARHRSALTVLDRSAPVPRSVPSDLEWLRQRLGANDRDVFRWSAKLSRLADLRTSLARLDGDALPGVDLRREAEVDLRRWESEVSADDPDASRWSARLGQAALAISALDTELAALDHNPLERATAERLVAVLAQREPLTGDDEAQRRWRAAIDAVPVRITTLRQRLAVLSDQAPITEASLRSLREDLAHWRAIMGDSDAEAATWQAAIEQRTAVINGLRVQLARLDQVEEIGVPLQLEMAPVLAQVRPLVSKDDPSLRGWEERLESSRARLAGLRLQLVRLDDPPPMARGDVSSTVRLLAAYRALVSPDDGQLHSWERRLAREVAELSAAEAAVVRLDQREPLPAGIAAAIARVAAGNADAPSVQRWSAKIARVQQIHTALGPPELVVPSPQVQALIDELATQWTGADDPLVRQVRTRLERAATLRKQLQALTNAVVLPVDSPLDQALAEIITLEGSAAPDIAAWRTRHTILAGLPRPAWAQDAGRDAFGAWCRLTQAGMTLTFRLVAPGTFTVGSPGEEAGRDDDEGVATRTLSHACWMLDSEVSQELWQAVMGTNPSRFRGSRLPVDSLSRSDAVDFCAAWSRAAPELSVRLPSEAEWERACRAGDAGIYHGSEGALAVSELAQVARFAADGPLPVRALRANRLGIFDLHGNLWEWCADGYAPSPAQATDHVGVGEQGVLRGGSWADAAVLLRSANRVAVDPALRSRQVGLRVVIESAR